MTTQDQELRVISLVLVSSNLISLLSFSPINICDWAFWTGLISHLRALMGKKVIRGWSVWPSHLTVFDLLPPFRCECGIMYHTHMLQHLNWWLIHRYLQCLRFLSQHVDVVQNFLWGLMLKRACHSVLKCQVSRQHWWFWKRESWGMLIFPDVLHW